MLHIVVKHCILTNKNLILSNIVAAASQTTEDAKKREQGL